MLVRPVREEDLTALWAITREPNTSSWSKTQLAAEIQAPGGLGLVLEQQQQNGGTNQQELIHNALQGILGYAFFRIFPPEAELLQISVASLYRRQGMAGLLMHNGLRQVAKRGCTDCFLELRSSNLAARKLYHQHGFQQLGSRKNYYRNPVEDALLFRLCLNNMEKETQ